MRITFVSPPFNMTGGHRVIATYAERLRRRGHEVLVVGPSRARPGPRVILRSLSRGRGWPKMPARTPSHFDNIDVECRLVRHGQPVTDADVPDADVVIATWWRTAEWVERLSPRKGAKVYFLQGHDTYPPQPIDRVESTWRLPFHKIAISRWLVDLARDRYGDDRVSLVPNAVDLDLFQAPPRHKNATPTVGMVYTKAPIKGCDVSLRAFALCASRFPGLKLLAFGSEPIAPGLPLPPGASFFRSPAQRDIPAIYSGCDAWLYGSRSEGFGLPILEAMACRTPVVASPAGAAPDLLAGGGGLLVGAENPPDMARAIERILSLPDREWVEMSDAAYVTATRYTWDDATAQFERALELAIERPTRGEIRGGEPGPVTSLPSRSTMGRTEVP